MVSRKREQKYGAEYEPPASKTLAKHKATKYTGGQAISGNRKKIRNGKAMRVGKSHKGNVGEQKQNKESKDDMLVDVAYKPILNSQSSAANLHSIPHPRLRISTPQPSNPIRVKLLKALDRYKQQAMLTAVDYKQGSANAGADVIDKPRSLATQQSSSPNKMFAMNDKARQADAVVYDPYMEIGSIQAIHNNDIVELGQGLQLLSLGKFKVTSDMLQVRQVKPVNRAASAFYHIEFKNPQPLANRMCLRIPLTMSSEEDWCEFVESKKRLLVVSYDSAYLNESDELDASGTPTLHSDAFISPGKDIYVEVVLDHFCVVGVTFYTENELNETHVDNIPYIGNATVFIRNYTGETIRFDGGMPERQGISDFGKSGVKFDAHWCQPTHEMRAIAPDTSLRAVLRMDNMRIFPGIPRIWPWYEVSILFDDTLYVLQKGELKTSQDVRPYVGNHKLLSLSQYNNAQQ